MKNLLIIALAICAMVSSTYGQEKRVLSLEECITIAVENNLSVQRSQLNLATAQVNLMQSRGQRYPTINLSGNYGYNWGRSIDPTTNQFINQRIVSSGFSGNSSMPILSGMQIYNSIEQSKVDVEAAQYDLRKSSNDISLNTALVYLNVIFNKELLGNARFQLESSNQQLDRTKKLVQSGALPVSNELQLASQVATNEVNLVTAENNLDLAVLDLKQALLLPPGQEIDIVIPDIEISEAQIESKTVDGIYQVAISNQPEIKSVDLKVQSARLGLKAARGAMYPSLTANAGFRTNYSDAADRSRLFFDGTQIVPTEVGYLQSDPTQLVFADLEQPVVTGSDPDFTFSEQYDENLSKFLSFGVSIPILNGFNTRSSIQRSTINFQQAEISAVEQRNVLYQTIESAYRNALAAAKTFTASQRQVEALEETFRSVENQYNLGSSNFTDYQVASNNLFQARSDLSRAKYDFVFKQKVLDFYQGIPLSF